jgi:hypothetical protein
MNPDNTRKHYQLIDAVAVTNGVTATGTVDTAGAKWATILINFSVIGSTANGTGPLIEVEEADADSATNYGTVIANRTTEDITSAKTVAYEIDLRGRKRFLQLSVTAQTTNNTNGDFVMSSNIILDNLGDGPSSASEKIESGGVVVEV